MVEPGGPFRCRACLRHVTSKLAYNYAMNCLKKAEYRVLKFFNQDFWRQLKRYFYMVV